MDVSNKRGPKDALLTLFVVAVLATLVYASKANAATFTVTDNGDPGPGTLRAAVNAANANGTSADTIAFDPSLVGQTILLSTDGNKDSSGNTLFPGPSALVVSSRIAIVGPSGEDGVTIARHTAAPNLRLFSVSGSGDLTLENLTLKDGLAKGGEAFGGGGGAAGLGGAVFNEGELRVEASTLSGNTAQGGIGNDNLAGSGGGGGLGGDGGFGLTGEGDGGPPDGGTKGSAGSPDGEDGGDGGGGGGGYGLSVEDLGFDGDGGDGGFGGFGGGGGGGGGTNRGSFAGLGGDGGFGAGGGAGWGGDIPTDEITGRGGFGGGGGSVGGFIGQEHQVGAGGGGGGLGGAIFNSGGGVTLENSTLSGNAARGGDSEGSGCLLGGCPGGGGGGFGGGLFNLNGSVDANSTTFANNTVAGGTGFFQEVGATEGGGIYSLERTGVFRSAGPQGDATLDLANSVLADSTGAADCQNNGGTTSGNDDLIESNAAGNESCAGATSGADPLLGPLSDNGGPTDTHELLSGSPAIDAGATDLATDQRGSQRPKDGDTDGTAEDDAGSFERAPGSVRFSAEAYTVNEGAGTATIAVARTGGTDGEVSVEYATSDGTAEAGSDYTSTSGTLTFANGETSKTFSVPISNDATDEPDETVSLSLRNPSGATLGTPTTATLTIADDDPEPSLSISNDTVAEGDSGTTDATFTVSLSSASGKTVTVNYATQDGTADAAPGDYGATSGTLTFAPGDTTKQITVSVNGDRVDESDETFFVNLSDPNNATISDAQGVGTVTDDDTAGITVEPTSGLTTTEAGGTGSFTVVLDSQPTSAVTIALVGSDTTEGAAFPASLTFTPEDYDTPQTVTVTGVDDNADDGDVAYEVVTAAAESTDANYAGLNAADVSVTNTDNDAAPAISIDDVSIAEGDSGTRDATFTVTLDRESSRSVTVDFATEDRTAEAPFDYRTASGTLTFLRGETQQTITVPVRGDTLNEPGETFEVRLSNPSNATITDGLGIGTIVGDDAAPSLSVSDDRVTEGDHGTRDAAFVVTLSSASGKTVTVEYATSDGTAHVPSDYATRSGALTFAPGQTQKTVSVPVRGDLAVEADETFFVRLSVPTDATISDRVGRGTIADDDGCTITGTGSSDSLVGTANRDVICALDGDDTVLALGGDDVVRGGSGDDTVQSSSGADTAYGGGGDDLLTGGNGEDNLVGGAGKDLLSGQGGDDRLDARDGTGGDTLDGGPGTDACRRDGGDDVKNCP